MSSSDQPAEHGYEADLDNPDDSQKPSHSRYHLNNHSSPLTSSPIPPVPSSRMRRANGNALPMLPPHPPASSSNAQPPSPLSTGHVPKAPTPPTMVHDRQPLPNAPPSHPRHTFKDKFGHIFPHPGPPPPLSPRRPDPSDDFNFPAPHKNHIRSGSDAGADRDRELKATEVQMDSLAAQWRNNASANKEPTFIRKTRNDPPYVPQRRRENSIVDEDNADSWVMINDAAAPQELLAPRVSPTSLSRSPARPPATSRFPAYGALASSSRSKAVNSSTMQGFASDGRPSTGNRSGSSANKAIPPGFLVTWKGEDNSRNKGGSSSGSSGKTLGSKTLTKSMDNLRAFASTRRHPPPNPSYQPGRPPQSTAYQPTPNIPGVSGTPKSYTDMRPVRPLPVHGSPHASNADFHSGSAQSFSNYSRSTAYPPSTNVHTVPDPYPRPLSAADSPITSPTHNQPLLSPTYGSTLTSGSSAPSPRAVSPSRVSGPRPPYVHYDTSDRYSEVHSGPETSTSTPPRTPISPSNYSTSESTTVIVESSSPSVESATYIPQDVDASEMTLRRDGNAKFMEALKDLNMVSRENLNHFQTPPIQNGVTDITLAVDDFSDESDEGTGGTWVVRPVRRPPSVKPELAPLQTADLNSNQGQSWPSRPAPEPQQEPYLQPGPPSHSSSYSNRTVVPQARPGSSRRPTDPPPPNRNNRMSTFGDDPDGDWAPRPLPEDVYDRLEDFFPEHDLDKPVIEANSGGNSPTNPEPVAPLPPPPAASASMAMQIQNERSRHRSTKKSIRLVAEEHKKRIERRSRPDLSSDNALRKRNTKLWGSKLEEVTTQMVKGSTNTIPESPGSHGGPSEYFRVRVPIQLADMIVLQQRSSGSVVS